jgi:hypothetical protein
MKNEWISINKSLPDFELPVLACSDNNELDIRISKLESVTKRKDSVSHEWIEVGSFELLYFNVTHWQYLPNPPKNDTP